jgi:hypothetical protein
MKVSKLTLPKYLSRSSTYRWMISRVSNSLSSVKNAVNFSTYFQNFKNLTLFYSATKVQTCVSKRQKQIRDKKILIWKLHRDKPFVNNLAVFPFEERAHLRFAGENCCNKFPCDFLLELVIVSHIPLLKTELSLTWEKEHELHLKLVRGLLRF